MEGSDLNEKPASFVWLCCFPKVEEKHIRPLGPLLALLQGGFFLWDHEFKLPTCEATAMLIKGQGLLLRAAVAKPYFHKLGFSAWWD